MLSAIKEFNVTKAYGYQVFRMKNRKLCSMFSPFDIGLKHEQWEKDKNNFILEAFFVSRKGQVKKYKTGFHIFLNKKDAEYLQNYYSKNDKKIKIVLRKVHFKNIVTTGVENWKKGKSFPVVVVRERLIHKA